MRSAVTCMLAAVLFSIVWLAINPAPSHMPTSDLYTHLSVARHLAHGEGYLNDVVYPISLAFPFAARVPQPLVHRPPGYATLLLLPYVLAGGDCGETLRWVHRFHVAFLVILIWIGLFAAGRIGRPEMRGAWLVLVAAAPALGYAVGWCEVEVVVAPLLFSIWLLGDRAARAGGAAALAYGFATGLLTLLRQDLAWVPLFWWAVWSGLRAFRFDRDDPRRWRRFAVRGALVVGIWLLTISPWLVRNYRVTGDPVFALQMRAEHLKMTRDWPGYSIYRSLSPEPLLTSVQKHPGQLARKTARGLRFYVLHIGRWLPWSVLIFGVATAGWRLVRRRAAGESIFACAADPTVLACVTLGLMVLQYVPFSHTLRHLLPMWPVMAWCLIGEAVRALDSWRRPGPTARLALLTVAALLALVLTPVRLPGWRTAALAAARQTALVEAAVVRASDYPPGPVFTDTAAVLWYTNRAGIWSPNSSEIEAELRQRIPGMADAPWLTLIPNQIPQAPAMLR